MKHLEIYVGHPLETPEDGGPDSLLITGLRAWSRSGGGQYHRWTPRPAEAGL